MDWPKTLEDYSLDFVLNRQADLVHTSDFPPPPFQPHVTQPQSRARPQLCSPSHPRAPMTGVDDGAVEESADEINRKRKSVVAVERSVVQRQRFGYPFHRHLSSNVGDNEHSNSLD